MMTCPTHEQAQQRDTNSNDRLVAMRGRYDEDNEGKEMVKNEEKKKEERIKEQSRDEAFIIARSAPNPDQPGQGPGLRLTWGNNEVVKVKEAKEAEEVKEVEEVLAVLVVLFIQAPNPNQFNCYWCRGSDVAVTG